MNPKNIGERFVELRRERHWTQDRLATELGITAAYVSMIETGAKVVKADATLVLLLDRIEREAGHEHEAPHRLHEPAPRYGARDAPGEILSLKLRAARASEKLRHLADELDPEKHQPLLE